VGYSKVIQSGNILEIYEYQKQLPERRNKPKKDRVGGKKSATRRSDNASRLKRHFIRLAGANLVGTECPLFFTFTMVEIVRIEIAYRIFTAFIQKLRRQYGLHWRYIAVPEFQKRGAVHFHVLFWGLPEKIEIDERNTRTIQRLWARGFVDCFRTDGSPKLVGYLTKYMSKAMFDQRLFGAKAYSASRNALRPLLFRLDEEFDDVADYFLPVSNSPLQDRQFMTQWLGKGRYRLYN